MRKPKICAVIVDNDLAAVREVEPLVDLFEVRIDLIGDDWRTVAKQLTKPWIACNRKTDEGGSWQGSEAKRVEQLLEAVELGADIVDIELRTENRDKVVPLIKGKAKCLISFHDLEKTPPLDEMKEIIGRQRQSGADISKLVTTARSYEDNRAAWQLLAEFPGVKLVSFAMGASGYLSRLLCPLAGGEFTYASIKPGKESARGQMTVTEMSKIYDGIGTLSHPVLPGKTALCGIIGDPIEHSLSPAMHNAAFRKMGMDYLYLPFKVSKEELGSFVAGIRVLKVRGLNVTIPHKVAVLPFLDRLDPLAQKIGAVNTIVNDDGCLTGYNTDAGGFLQALRERGIEPKDKRVVVLGAGGASRAVSFSLAEQGSHLVILNRASGIAGARELAGSLSQAFGSTVAALALTRQNLRKALEPADILVNTTSVGMSPAIDQTPVDADLLRPNLIVYDIIYNPVKTRLLREAETKGANTISGIDMLVGQGALAFEKWTGRQAPTALMKAVITKALKRDEN